MAFRLKRGRSISEELRRVMQEEFRTALDSLDVDSPSEAAIHEARKSVKKIRAILRLLQPPLGSSYATENRRLREAAHHIAPIRDADATIETLRLLHGRYQAVISEANARDITRGLEAQRRKAKAQAARRLAPAIRELRRSHNSAPGLVGKVSRVAAVRTGITRGYRRARETMANLSIDSDATQFHAWRRRVKDHSYHVRLFERLHPTPRGRARSLARLETWLGDDHNLALLRSTILGVPDTFGGARTTALVLGCIVKAQASLRQKALTLGHRLFGRKPAQFRHTVAEWWNTPART